jgi:adenylosuccinate synthase
MAVDVVIGAQRGDEGKGNFCAYLGLNGDYSIAVRSASPQAGHSIYLNGKRFGIAHLPCAAVNPKLRLLLGGASFIDTKKLFYGGLEHRPHTGETIELQAEIPSLGLNSERLGIDYNAKLVTEQHKKIERESSLMKLGSIGSGVNSAKHDLIDKKATFVKEDLELLKFVTDSVLEMNNALAKGKNILFETDHGIELCQHFGGYFPYNTARTINTSAYLGEIGLPPQSVRDVHLVIKPYVSAVASKAPLKEEIFDKKTLDELLHEGGESGSISGRIRRIGSFDSESFKRAILLSGATKIDVSHLDLSQRVWNVCGFKNDAEFLDYVSQLCFETYLKPRLHLGCYGPRIEDVKRLD